MRAGCAAQLAGQPAGHDDITIDGAGARLQSCIQRAKSLTSCGERFFSQLSTFLNTAERQRETANEAYSHYVLERLRTTLLSLSALMDHLRNASPSNDPQAEMVSAQYHAEIADLVVCVREIYSQWERHIDDRVIGDVASSYSAVYSTVSRVGRPRFDITREQIEHLASLSFSWTQMAGMLGVSRNTLYCRRVEFGLSIGSPTENITNDQLHSILLHLYQEMPALGLTMTWGRLRSMGFTVRRERLRQAIREIDPLHTALRWRGDLTVRRPYSVPGPNCLWHLGKNCTDTIPPNLKNVKQIFRCYQY